MHRHRPSGAIQLDVEVAAGLRDAGVALVLQIVVRELHSDDRRGQLAPLSDLGEHVAFLVELDLRLGDRDMERHSVAQWTARNERQRIDDKERSAVSIEVLARDALRLEAVATMDNRLSVEIRGSNFHQPKLQHPDMKPLQPKRRHYRKSHH